MPFSCKTVNRNRGALGEELDEDFIQRQMQIIILFGPFELGVVPAAAGEGECQEGGELMAALRGQPSPCLLKAGYKDASLVLRKGMVLGPG